LKPLYNRCGGCTIVALVAPLALFNRYGIASHCCGIDAQPLRNDALSMHNRCGIALLSL
jgi:hypothetical protein